MSRFALILAASLTVGPLMAQEKPAEKAPARQMTLFQPVKPYANATNLLIQEIASHSELLLNLEEMCDGIGPRLTGSEKLRQAQQWAMQKLKGYGAVNVHEESYEFGRPWIRGISRGRLLNANGQSLNVAQMAWTEGTKGVLKGEVALLDVKTLDEFRAAAPGLAGKIVLLLSQPRPTPEERKNIEAYFEAYKKVLQDTHSLATLMTSDKRDDLQNMTGSPAGRAMSGAPTAFITQEHANLLKRLLARGVKPQMELELTGRHGEQPVRVYNVVADLPGSEKPEEVVIVGGHQDSWDLSTGATDNGTGTVVAMEVLRAMHAAGLKPKRTLRVVLFSGEEQGLLGSKAYVKEHAAELAKVQAVLIDDLGSGRIKGFVDMGVEAWRAPLAAAMSAANGLGAVELPASIMPGSTDHWPFAQRGVPAFPALQDPLDYFTHTHHSQVDSIDHVVKDDLVQGAQVMAVTAWGLLNGEPLPHQAPTAAPAGH